MAVQHGHVNDCPIPCAAVIECSVASFSWCSVDMLCNAVCGTLQSLLLILVLRRTTGHGDRLLECINSSVLLTVSVLFHFSSCCSCEYMRFYYYFSGFTCAIRYKYHAFDAGAWHHSLLAVLLVPVVWANKGKPMVLLLLFWQNICGLNILLGRWLLLGQSKYGFETQVHVLTMCALECSIKHM